ncbi:MAG: hypothetical protein HYX66_04555 [Ignavibacteria bacterium]|nr:hypothetical protein [Ignavibacteria bacterium]
MKMRVLAAILATTFAMVAVASAGVRCGEPMKASKASNESTTGTATNHAVKPASVANNEAAKSAATASADVKPATATTAATTVSDDHCSDAKKASMSASDKASCSGYKSTKSSMTSVSESATTAPTVASGAAVVPVAQTETPK